MTASVQPTWNSIDSRMLLVKEIVSSWIHCHVRIELLDDLPCLCVSCNPPFLLSTNVIYPLMRSFKVRQLLLLS